MKLPTLFYATTFFFIQLIFGSIVFAGEIRTQCKNETMGETEWSYCISKFENSKNPDILYYFHGIGGNSKSWSENYRKADSPWKFKQDYEPTVVSISFGEIWLLAQEDASEITGKLMGFITNAVIPEIEDSLGGLKGSRILVGASMGGFNASQLYLWYPEKFARVALLCPALAEISPYTSEADYEEFIKKTHADPDKANLARGIAKYIFKDESKWELASPFKLGEDLLNSAYPPLFVSTGREDDFGFFMGGEDFANLARSRGVPQVEWSPVDGKHCSFDANALIHFLFNS